MLRHYQAMFTAGRKASIDLIIALLGVPLGVGIWRCSSEPLIILRTPVPGSESKLRNNGLGATHGNKH